ncbi:AMP-binding protein [Flavobacterium hauense]
MNKLDYHFVHPHFKLNGFHLNEDDLKRIAYSFIKEGDFPFEKAVGDFLLDWFDQRDYIEMQTSGTTGVPKLIRVDKQAMINSALATGEFFDLPSGIKVLHCLPTQFVAGKMMLVRAFILGWDMDLVAPTSTPLRSDSQYDFAAMVPLQAQHSLDKLQQVKKIILGGAKVSQALSDQLVALPTKIYETYGMTETITHIAAKRVGEEAFTVLPNVRISEDDRHCLVIDPYVLCDEPVVTNDVVKVLDDTHFIWLGRYDNVINSGGVKLFPEQIEEKLSGTITQRFFVKGVADEELGEKLVMVVEGEPFIINEETVFKKLTRFEKPKEILFVPKFAETASGKIIRDKTLEEA